jgi:outer membrane biosynthesis protein TonB
MSVAGMPKGSLRQDQAQSSRLVWALVISLAVHGLFYGGYQVGKKYQLWERLQLPAWVHAPGVLSEFLKKLTLQPEPPKPQSQDTPLLFVDVSPAQAAAEAPQNAKYYSSQNSKAANPNPEKDLGLPKIEGKQIHVPQTEDVPKEKFSPLKPSPEPAPLAKEAQEEQKPKPALTPGDMVMAKAEPAVQKDTGQAERRRPRTIREALARQADNRLPGEKMKQEGGASRPNVVPAFDAKATPFGDYDRQVINAVRSCWWNLLDQREYTSDSHGKVVLQFKLHADGRVTDVVVGENTVGEVLGYVCQKAVIEAAPFPAWSNEMRLAFGVVRNVQFTFYYD